jgi:hypothetical protein
LQPVKVISKVNLLIIPWTGERNTNFMALFTNGGTVVAWDISASYFLYWYYYDFACSARWAWYAFQPGHQVVCQRHSRAIKDFGLASAFCRIGQVSQPNAFSVDGVWFVFMIFSLMVQ